MLVFDQQRDHESKLTVYFSCIGKGQLSLPISLRHLKQKMLYSKVKMYHPFSIAIEVHSKKTGENVLEELECPLEEGVPAPTVSWYRDSDPVDR